MAIFNVFWDAKIVANSKEDAAKICMEMLSDPECPARCFKIGEVKKGKMVVVYEDVPV